MINPRRFMVLLVVTILLCASFWIFSRYPELGQKSSSAGAVQIEEQLSHQSVISVSKNAGVAEKITVTFLNWLYANKRGMIFGVLIASCFLTLLSYLPKKASKNRFADSVYGMLAGTPLGVCVNCVAPISKAIYEGGKSLQTSLAMMFSSPGLNIVVLTMLFTLFPFYLAVIKVCATLVLILCIVPFLSDKTKARVMAVGDKTFSPLVVENWVSALIGSARDFAKSLLYIFIRTVPLMMLAGVLGAAVAHGWQSAGINMAREFSWLYLFAASFVGTFLPVPMAMDVMLAQSLMAANVNIGVVASLLFTLGMFSIYSFLIVWRMSSWLLACKVYCIVMFLGMLVGGLSNSYAEYSQTRWINYFDLYMQNTKVVNIEPPQKKRFNAQKIRELVPVGVGDGWKTIATYGEVKIHYKAHAKRSVAGKKLFTFKSARDIGIGYENEIDLKNYIEAFYHGRGVATGDYNKDGYLDVVLATNNGVLLYINDGENKFIEYPLDIAALNTQDVFVVALVDMDNDGWLDIYASTFGDKNYIVYNWLVDKPKAALDFANGGALVTLSAGFADVNGDGRLDILQGNWTQGEHPGIEAHNQLLLSSDGGYVEQHLQEQYGLTLSALFSDVNGDGKADLFVGNDWVVPDNFYFGEGDGQFKISNNLDKVFDLISYNTMSISSSDYDNDGDIDLYLAGIGGNLSLSESEGFIGKNNDKYCLDLKDKKRRSTCFMHGVLNEAVFLNASCDAVKRLADEVAVKDCLVAKMLFLATSKQDKSLCAKIPVDYKNQRLMCDNMFAVGVDRSPLDAKKDLPQLKNSNVLLHQNDDGKFVDVAKNMGVNFAGWAWNAQFADVDNDGWQDLYVVNGSPMTNFIRFSHYLFLNQQGESFKQGDVGLENFAHSSAYSYVDYDNDGDLDILVNTTGGEYLFYENGSQANAISFELEQGGDGNRQCIGCVVKVETADGLKQMRELKKSGGYLSFDSARVYFGLAGNQKITRLTVQWTDGTTFVIQQPLGANKHYKIVK